MIDSFETKDNLVVVFAIARHILFKSDDRIAQYILSMPPFAMEK